MKSNQSAQSDREKLFFKYVWDHTGDDFYASFDIPPERKERLLNKAIALMENIQLPEEELVLLLTKLVNDGGAPDTEFLAYVTQIAGYTRSKILSDLDAQKLPRPSSLEGLISKRGKFQTHPSWKRAAAMLILRLREILIHLSEDDWKSRLRALDLATYPGYIRQKRAKYIGHYAEKVLAEVLDRLEIPFVPKQKKDNPLYGDVTLELQRESGESEKESFDLIIPHDKEPVIAIKSTIHTSNTGQYGESKDKLEIEKARNLLDELSRKSSRKIILVALADGVGYKSNREALRGLFQYADEVVQFATLWKIPVMAAKELGLGHVTVEFYGTNTDQAEDFSEFINKWEVGLGCNKCDSGKCKEAKIGKIAKVCLLKD